MYLKATVLVDNTDGIRVRGEWGLSFYIEYGDKTILLDAGQSDRFAENARLIDKDISKVDYAVLSHAHYDHANGFETFFNLNDKAMLYVAEGSSDNCYDRKGLFYKYIGMHKGMMKRHENRIIRAGSPESTDGALTKISDGIWLLAHTSTGLDNVGRTERMYTREGLFRYKADEFRHEQSLIFEIENDLAVFNSCSHAGADTIIREVSEAFPDRGITAMTGGFHLFNKDEAYVVEFAKRLEETAVRRIYTGHCTGDKAMCILKESLDDRVFTLYSGMEFEL